MVPMSSVYNSEFLTCNKSPFAAASQPLPGLSPHHPPLWSQFPGGQTHNRALPRLCFPHSLSSSHCPPHSSRWPDGFWFLWDLLDSSQGSLPSPNSSLNWNPPPWSLSSCPATWTRHFPGSDLLWDQSVLLMSFPRGTGMWTTASCLLNRHMTQKQMNNTNFTMPQTNQTENSNQ